MNASISLPSHCILLLPVHLRLQYSSLWQYSSSKSILLLAKMATLWGTVVIELLLGCLEILWIHVGLVLVIGLVAACAQKQRNELNTQVPKSQSPICHNLLEHVHFLFLYPLLTITNVCLHSHKFHNTVDLVRGRMSCDTRCWTLRDGVRYATGWVGRTYVILCCVICGCCLMQWANANFRKQKMKWHKCSASVWETYRDTFQ